MRVLIGLRESIKLCMDSYCKSRLDLIDYKPCDPAHPVDNMNKVFQVVEKFGIINYWTQKMWIRLEEKSIMIYVSYLYQV